MILSKKNMEIQFSLKSINKLSLNSYITFLKNQFKILNLKYALFNLPKKKKRVTLLKSPHVNKTAREQFEIRFYKTIIKINSTNLINNPNFFSFIINKPKTVTLKISLNKL